MSKIAEALAKAKERTGTTTAPFLIGQTGLIAAQEKAKQEALRKARNHQRLWVALLSVAAVLTTVMLWTQFGASNAKQNAPMVAAAQQPAPAPAPPPEPAGPPALVLPARNGAGPAAPAVEPRADTYRTVNELVITAVLPGEKPRLMYQGRIVNAGEPVGEELVFAGVQDGQVVFNDRRGAIYVRRY
jgi:hypothetical protein